MLAESGGISESGRGVCPEGDRGEPDGDWLVEPVAGKEDFPGYLSGKECFGFCFSGRFDSIYLGGTPSGALFRGGHAFLGYASSGDARGEA